MRQPTQRCCYYVCSPNNFQVRVHPKYTDIKLQAKGGAHQSPNVNQFRINNEGNGDSGYCYLTSDKQYLLVGVKNPCSLLVIRMPYNSAEFFYTFLAGNDDLLNKVLIDASVKLPTYPPNQDPRTAKEKFTLLYMLLKSEHQGQVSLDIKVVQFRKSNIVEKENDVKFRYCNIKAGSIGYFVMKFSEDSPTKFISFISPNLEMCVNRIEKREQDIVFDQTKQSQQPRMSELIRESIVLSFAEGKTTWALLLAIHSSKFNQGPLNQWVVSVYMFSQHKRADPIHKAQQYYLDDSLITNFDLLALPETKLQSSMHNLQDKTHSFLSQLSSRSLQFSMYFVQEVSQYAIGLTSTRQECHHTVRCWNVPEVLTDNDKYRFDKLDEPFEFDATDTPLLQSLTCNKTQITMPFINQHGEVQLKQKRQVPQKEGAIKQRQETHRKLSFKSESESEMIVSFGMKNPNTSPLSNPSPDTTEKIGIREFQPIIENQDEEQANSPPKNTAGNQCESQDFSVPDKLSQLVSFGEAGLTSRLASEKNRRSSEMIVSVTELEQAPKESNSQKSAKREDKLSVQDYQQCIEIIKNIRENQFYELRQRWERYCRFYSRDAREDYFGSEGTFDEVINPEMVKTLRKEENSQKWAFLYIQRCHYLNRVLEGKLSNANGVLRSCRELFVDKWLKCPQLVSKSTSEGLLKFNTLKRKLLKLPSNSMPQAPRSEQLPDHLYKRFYQMKSRLTQVQIKMASISHKQQSHPSNDENTDSSSDEEVFYTKKSQTHIRKQQKKQYVCRSAATTVKIPFLRRYRLKDLTVGSKSLISLVSLSQD